MKRHASRSQGKKAFRCSGVMCLVLCGFFLAAIMSVSVYAQTPTPTPTPTPAPGPKLKQAPTPKAGQAPAATTGHAPATPALLTPTTPVLQPPTAGTGQAPTLPNTNPTTITPEGSKPAGQKPGGSEHKCEPPKPEKQPKPVSPDEVPDCYEKTDEGPDIYVQLIPEKKEICENQRIAICAQAWDCDFWLKYCTYDGKKYWLQESKGYEYNSMVDPAPFTFSWSSTYPSLTPGAPCAWYQAPAVVTKELKVTITCVVDDPGTLDPRDPPVTAKTEIKVKKCH